MRTALERLYMAAAWLAAFMMVGLLIMVLLSILGRQFGFHVRGTDAYAGYLMAGAGFLALAHTLKRGEHIRVTLLLQSLSPGAKHRLELFALAAALLLSVLLALFSVKLCWQSLQFNDISTGNDATPLWLPQISMAVGTLILAVAFLDEFVLEWQGRRVVASSDEALHNE